MLDKKEFAEMRKEIAARDEAREKIIALSRDIISLSKRVIYATLRRDLETARKKLAELKGLVAKLRKIDIPLDTNISSTAYQEYVEAAAILHFAEKGDLITRKALDVDAESYLLGMCDLTGELVRKAVDEAINQNFDAALRIKELVSLIYGEFLEFNLRNSELRKKSDQIKWNLQKIEDLVCDVKVKGRA
ncbi:TPA: hypothetical protein HA372_06515 [Candidatus Woesearchaeota archaeon]|nr:hypothetical protein [Candidatus Woesearchaeota archaeon]HIJ19312.1 hypothetical protein [Candidatus Woesearchaeota archaeon]